MVSVEVSVVVSVSVAVSVDVVVSVSVLVSVAVSVLVCVALSVSSFQVSSSPEHPSMITNGINISSSFQLLVSKLQ